MAVLLRTVHRPPLWWEILDIADLFDGAVVLFDVPVPVMLFGEGFPADGGKLIVIGQVNCIPAGHK